MSTEIIQQEPPKIVLKTDIENPTTGSSEEVKIPVATAEDAKEVKEAIDNAQDKVQQATLNSGEGEVIDTVV